MNAKTVLVVAAHPDDEVLGCGGTIARHVDAGDAVHVLIMAEGVTSRAHQRDTKNQANELSALAHAAHQANHILGTTSLTLQCFPDNRMDSIDLLEVIQSVERFIARHAPVAVLYTHHGGDVNIDHRIVNQAVVTACRPLPAKPSPTVLFFEIASSTEWQIAHSSAMFYPNWFVDVTSSLERKLQALAAYHAEMRDWPHARSIAALEHMMRWRGASVGVDAAEAFMLGRKIIL